jgi:ketosteroid isomerase-like protein
MTPFADPLGGARHTAELVSPEENVAIVRAVYERWGQGDFRAGIGSFDPWVVLVLRGDFPDAGAYLGLEGIKKYTRQLLEGWDHAVIEGEEFTPAGDSVVVRVHQQASGQRSGVPVDMRYFQVWTLRGGSVIRIENVMEREEALEAVGRRD